MTVRPIVSVIIANYNTEKYIAKCLDNLLSQTYNNIEIIVCDDNSSDNSPQIIEEYVKRYPNIFLLRNTKNLRAAATRNRCLHVSKGDYIVIQDADDFSAITRIEEQLNFMLSNPTLDFVSSDAHLFSGTDYTSKGIISFGKIFPSKWSFLWGMPFIHPATMFRTSCIRGVNGYRVCEETRRGQDYDMLMRMYAQGFKGANIKKPLYWYRLDENTIKRHSNSSAYDEYKVRIHGFKAMGLMPIGYLFALKPYIANLAHKLGWFKF